MTKGQSSYEELGEAREPKKHIDRIRRDYIAGLRHDVIANR